MAVSGATVEVGSIVGIMISVAVGFGSCVGDGGSWLTGLRVLVGVMIRSVLVGVVVALGVMVGVNVWVTDAVSVGISLENASAVNMANEFGLEKAKLTTLAGSIAMGVARVGSDNATAEAPQKRLKPRMLAEKIHRSPA